jgi:CheY-like chemotaxis protein
MENILVFDSHQEYARYLTAHLVEEGYQVTAAFPGAEAIEKIQFTIFSLIFFDMD